MHSICASAAVVGLLLALVQGSPIEIDTPALSSPINLTEIVSSLKTSPVKGKRAPLDLPSAPLDLPGAPLKAPVSIPSGVPGSPLGLPSIPGLPRKSRRSPLDVSIPGGVIPAIPGVTEPLTENDPPLPVLQVPTPPLQSPPFTPSNIKPKKIGYFWTGAGDNQHKDFLVTTSLDDVRLTQS